MRIEVIGPGELERERYEFVVRVDSLAVRVRLIGYRHERRESKRHRNWHAFRMWSYSLNKAMEFPASCRLNEAPPVPVAIEREMWRNFNRACKKEYIVDYKQVQEAQSVVRN